MRIRNTLYIVTLVLEGRIYIFVKWQIRPSNTKVTILCQHILVSGPFKLKIESAIVFLDNIKNQHARIILKYCIDCNLSIINNNRYHVYTMPTGVYRRPGYVV